MAQFELTMTGVAPLLMHSARLSDPIDPATKALSKVTSKRNKTDEDHLEAARLEHLGSLYVDSGAGPFLPGQNIEAALFRGASKSKLMSALKPALLIPQEVNPLIYSGPRDAAGLWADKQFVHRASAKVGTSRVIRTRPVFPAWRCVATGELDTQAIDPDQFVSIAATTGRVIGLGDWRPRFGRFEAQVKWL
ncbi:MAG: hypothetical protein ACRCZP_05395 [Phycicoccus sp.]